jgi:hypothetical protein
MYVDPQSDASAILRERKSEANDTNRNNWEFQERVRQHLLANNAEELQGTTASFQKRPPDPFPVWISPDAESRTLSGYTGTPDPTGIPESMQKNILAEAQEKSKF